MRFTNFKGRLDKIAAKSTASAIRLFMPDGSVKTIPGSGQFMLEVHIDNMRARHAEIVGKEAPPRRHPIETEWVRDCVACDGPPEMIRLAKTFTPAKGANV